MLIMGYLGAVIGAGFASGQEIVQFFVIHEAGGLKGAIFAALLFSLCGGLLLYWAHKYQVSKYQDILNFLMGARLSRIVDVLLAGFLFLGISTMLSASGAVFYEHLYLSSNLGIFVAYALVMLFLMTGKKGLFASYNILVPLKIILLLLIAGYAAFYVNVPNNNTYLAFTAPRENGQWAISSILYVAYNFSLAMVVLTEYQTISTRRDAIIGATWGGGILGLLVIINYLALSKFVPAVLHYEVPMLYVAGQISITAKYVYTLVLWVGILTTALANAYGFAQRFSSYCGLSFRLCLFLCMTLALPVSMQSFSSLVGSIYPIFGILGAVILITLIYRAGKDMVKDIYYNIIKFFS